MFGEDRNSPAIGHRSRLTQWMVLPRGARGFGRRWLMRSCVNVFGFRLEHVLRAIMDISAHAILLTDRPRRAVSVTRVRTRREDQSSIVVSSSRKTGRGANGTR